MKKLANYTILIFSIFAFLQGKAQLIDLGKCDANHLTASGFRQLKKTIGNARIVVIGEQSHGVGTDYENFAILTKFLHEELGFNVVLQEFCIYHFGELNKSIQYGGSAQAYRQGMYWPQAKAMENDALLEYINQQAKTSNPLYMEGIDPRIFLRKSFYNYCDSLLAENGNIMNPEASKVYLETLNQLLLLEYRDTISTVCQKNDFYDQTVSIISQLKKGGYSERTIHLFKNLLAFAKNAWNFNQREMNDPDRFIERERMMGENVIWFAEKIYPNEKIIVHLHNGHAAKNFEQLKAYLPDTITKKETNTGSIINGFYGNASKFIATTYHSGTYCKWDYKPKNIPTPQPKSLENDLHNKGLSYAYLNVINKAPFYMFFNDFNEWLPNNKLKAPFGKLFDGVIFIDHVKMPTDTSATKKN